MIVKIIGSIWLFITLHFSGWSQYPPTGAGQVVQWNFTAQKVGDKTYELRLTATVQKPWHIYSQFTPEGGPVPTSISFNKDPLLQIHGATKEVGKLETKHEEVFGLDVKYFDGKVDFVRTITVRSKVKTNVSGTITFMVCNDRECLPPRFETFSIPLQ